MRAVFGIDVSKTSSKVAILVNGEKVHGYTILNDAIGFNRLLGDLKTVHNPEIIFTKNYATSAVSIRILLRILSALKTVCTRSYKSPFLNWKISYPHQLASNIGT